MSTKRSKWEMNLRQARDLRKKGAELLFDRVSLLIACYNDQDFRAWCADQGSNECDYLDDELNDTAFDFLTLKAVVVEYPHREQWVKHNIRDLVAEVLTNQRRDDKADDATKRMSWKERALAAERRVEQLERELAALREAMTLMRGVA